MTILDSGDQSGIIYWTAMTILDSDDQSGPAAFHDAKKVLFTHDSGISFCDLPAGSIVITGRLAIADRSRVNTCVTFLGHRLSK